MVLYVVWGVAVAVCLAASALLLILSRLRSLTGRVGSFECSLASAGRQGPGWSSGVAQYGVGRLDWWRAASLLPRPARVWRRDGLCVVAREPIALGAGRDQYRVRCRYEGQEFDLVMSVGAYEGLTSWLEACPPSPRNVVV